MIYAAGQRGICQDTESQGARLASKENSPETHKGSSGAVKVREGSPTNQKDGGPAEKQKEVFGNSPVLRAQALLTRKILTSASKHVN